MAKEIGKMYHGSTVRGVEISASTMVMIDELLKKRGRPHKKVSESKIFEDAIALLHAKECNKVKVDK